MTLFGDDDGLEEEELPPDGPPFGPSLLPELRVVPVGRASVDECLEEEEDAVDAPLEVAFVDCGLVESVGDRVL